MDNELSNSMVLAVELIVLSAVIGIVLLFAGIGQQFERSTVESISDVVASEYGSEIEALEENIDPVPVATVYLVLERNTDLVKEVKGKIQGNSIADKESLDRFFSQKVTVLVNKVFDGTKNDTVFITTVGG